MTKTVLEPIAGGIKLKIEQFFPLGSKLRYFEKAALPLDIQDRDISSIEVIGHGITGSEYFHLLRFSASPEDMDEENDGDVEVLGMYLIDQFYIQNYVLESDAEVDTDEDDWDYKDEIDD